MGRWKVPTLAFSWPKTPAIRKKLYHSIEDIQADLDVFMEQYNTERTNQGRHCQGRTPFQTFLEGLEIYQRHVYEGLETEEAA